MIVGKVLFQTTIELDKETGDIREHREIEIKQVREIIAVLNCLSSSMQYLIEELSLKADLKLPDFGEQKEDLR